MLPMRKSTRDFLLKSRREERGCGRQRGNPLRQDTPTQSVEGQETNERGRKQHEPRGKNTDAEQPESGRVDETQEPRVRIIEVAVRQLAVQDSFGRLLAFREYALWEPIFLCQFCLLS